MEKFDEKITNIARKERIEIPEGYENRIETLLTELSNGSKLKRCKVKVNISRYTKIVAGFAVLVMISVCGFMVHAGTSDERKVDIKKTELDEICITNTNRLDVESDEYGVVEYHWNSYDELQEGLGVRLLRSEGECEAELMNILDQTDNEDYHIIQIDNFAVTEQRPINMTISIQCSEEQSIEGLLTEFMGDFQRRGNYISKQGYKVIFIKDKILSLQDTNDDAINGTLFGFFVANGILYEVSGELSVNQMKEFIDSLYFLYLIK